jgi:hypothetical protein
MAFATWRSQRTHPDVAAPNRDWAGGASRPHFRDASSSLQAQPVALEREELLGLVRLDEQDGVCGDQPQTVNDRRVIQIEEGRNLDFDHRRRKSSHEAT